MRTYWRSIIIAFAVLATVSVNAETLGVDKLTDIVAGSDVPLRVFTYPNKVDTCVLITPAGVHIDLIPEDKSDDKYELNHPDFLHYCRVTIKDVQETDNGKWELRYTGHNDTEQNIIGSNLYYITVMPQGSKDTSAENNTESAKETEEDGINRIVLPKINFGARKDVNITITLSRKDYAEECYLRTPQGDLVKLENIEIDGIQAYVSRTNFVSCRVIIGPMMEKLLGTWTLCGQHHDEYDVVHERCQPGQIEWAINNPFHQWDSRIEAPFDHPVHFGGILSPAVRGFGAVKTCHVITPNGEDIAVTPDSDYPGLVRAVVSDTTLCQINIGEIDNNFLGEWTLYGTYESYFGFNVVSQPMTFYLYDEEKPHSQAYNVTNLQIENHIVLLGEIFTVSVTATGTTDTCEFFTNIGEHFHQNSSIHPFAKFSSTVDGACHLVIGPVSQEMLGNWTLIGKFNVNNVVFIELRLPFNILEEDPANPFEDERYEITNINSQDIVTRFAESHTFSIRADSMTTTDSCHLRTPDNMQYILRDDMNLEGVEFTHLSSASCTVTLLVGNEEMIGSWILIARVNRLNRLIELRLPFTINVEEQVEALPNATTVSEGTDLYLRLENPTNLYETCTIVGPTSSEASRDVGFIDTCGFIIHHVTLEDSGTWEIRYGDKAKYRAFVQVTVTERSTFEHNSFTWVKGETVNKIIGPKDTIYCRLETPAGVPVFEGFGLCHIILDRVREEHEGRWKMIVGTTGRVLTEIHYFDVKLISPATKHEVMTSVKHEKPHVMLSCLVESEYEVTACKFRDPSGNVLLAAQGVGEDRYSFYGSSVGFESNVTKHECGLRITNPVVEELGIWMCAVQTEAETYYGFVSALCPWAMQDPEIAAAVISEPSLTTEIATVVSMEGDVTTMSCSIQSPIQYCYFRAQNGSIYNANSANSHWYEYAGSGLDAGDCGIRFPSLQASDSGRWSCHVGFEDANIPEQRVNIQLKVKALMEASLHHMENQQNTLVVKGQVYDLRSVEYCRFVRIDGLGFKSEHMPLGYEDHSLLAEGHCEIRVDHPSILDMHPWTVVARILGHDAEIFRSTDHILNLPEESEKQPEGTPITHPEEEPSEFDPHGNYNQQTSFVLLWSFVMAISVALFFLGILLGPKTNREWAYRRATVVHESIRSSFRKQPLPNNVTTTKNTPNAA